MAAVIKQTDEEKLLDLQLHIEPSIKLVMKYVNDTYLYNLQCSSETLDWPAVLKAVKKTSKSLTRKLERKQGQTSLQGIGGAPFGVF